jgi:RarD protein
MYWAIIIQQFIASTTHIVAKNILLTVPAPLLLLLRASIATFSYLFLLKIRKMTFKKIEKQDLFLFIILAILNIPVNQYLFFLSLKHTSAPNVALAYALTPAFVLIIAFFFLREKISKTKASGIFVAIGGTMLILFEKGLDFKSDNFYGNILALLASLAWAVYTIIGKRFVVKYGAIYTTFLAMGMGLIAFLPIFFLSGVDFDIAAFSTIDWMQIFYLGVITSGVAYVLWYVALKRLEASKLAVFNNLQPILTTIMAIIFFGHELTALFVLGGCLTLSGVFITQRG